jgi:hypothetical protein
VLGPPAHARLAWRHRAAVGAWAALALGGARVAHGDADRPACHYTAALAEALYLAHPEADLDGDGVLSRDEACELQAELRRHNGELASRPEEPGDEALLSESLCCNCERPGANSGAVDASCAITTTPENATRSLEGVGR